MARKPKLKNLINSRLLKAYASWVYCTECNKTVAYLCYVAYDMFDFEYSCKCGNIGRVHVEFEHNKPVSSDEALIIVKNRSCCPKDKSPLVTIINKNLKSYKFSIICNVCNNIYSLREEESR